MKKNVDTQTIELYNAVKAAYINNYNSGVISSSLAKKATAYEITRLISWYIELPVLKKEINLLNNREILSPVTKDILQNHKRRLRIVENNIKNSGLSLLIPDKNKVINLIESYQCGVLALPRIYNDLCKLVGEKPIEIITVNITNNLTTEAATEAPTETVTETPTDAATETQPEVATETATEAPTETETDRLPDNEQNNDTGHNTPLYTVEQVETMTTQHCMLHCQQSRSRRRLSPLQPLPPQSKMLQPPQSKMLQAQPLPPPIKKPTQIQPQPREQPQTRRQLQTLHQRPIMPAP